MLDKLPYNADINLLASIPSLEHIFDALAGRESKLSQDQRTAKTSNRLTRVIKKNLLVFHTENHKILVNGANQAAISIDDKKVLLFLQLAVTNRLCHDLIDGVILNYYLQGRVGVKKMDLISYIKSKEILSDDTGEPWAETTLERVGSKLLTFLVRLDILKGKQKKLFQTIRFTDQQFTLYLYFMMSVWGEELNVLTHPFRKFSFASDAVIMERTKEIAKKGWIDMKYTGDQLITNPTYNYSDIANAI